MSIDVLNQCVTISRSVGAGFKSVNLKPDVEIVQQLLNKHLGRLWPPRGRLVVTGTADPQTIQTIRDFQKQVVGFNKPDGRVDPAGKTLRVLNEPASPLIRPDSGKLTTPTSPEDSLAAFIERLGLRHISAGEVTRGLGRRISEPAQSPDIPKAEGRNGEPPSQIWHNIAPTLIVLDEIREQVGVSINLTNTYRSPEYNNANYIRSKARKVRAARAQGKTLSFDDAKSGVATLSQHMIFRAVDFTVSGGKRIEAFNIAKKLRGHKFELPQPLRMANLPIRKVGYVGGRTVYFNASGLRMTDESFEFHGGLGLYATFIHIDCRGQDRTW
jgi:uncharacterized protein YcbK (DUF882 family)